MAVHLMTHSVYSLLSSTLTINKLVTQAKAKGFKAIALSDYHNMHAGAAFILACQKHKIKPILGVTLTYISDDISIPFVILAKNLKGYQNLSHLVSQINQSPYQLQLEDLQTHQDEVVVIVLSEGGIFEAGMLEHNQGQIQAAIERLNGIFKHYVVGISMNHSPYWIPKNEFLKSILKANGIEGVALSKVYYDKKEDSKTLLALQAIKSQKRVNDPSLIQYDHHHLLSVDELVEFYDLEDLEATDRINAQIETYSLEHLTTLPVYDNQQGVDNKTYLRSLCRVGFNKRYPKHHQDKTYLERLSMELDLITRMNYEDYFLIVYDIVRYARSQKIPVGPGRGSAAGSMVAYCLGITHVDPMTYGLLFERFLNAERISMPDIDIDFSDKRRDEVIAYLIQKYGKEHVGHIVTFGSLKAKMSLRDVGRAYDIPLRTMDRLIKQIPNRLNISLRQAFEQSTNFKRMISEDASLQEVFEMAMRIENFPRHVSTHAAGLVLSKVKLDQVVPLIQIEDNILASQYSMEYLEKLGLIKIDLLGLRNLTIIDEIVQSLKLDLDLLKLPLDDQKTFDLLAAGDTSGIFQLESEGMRRLLIDMKCSSFDDIIASLALYRPGPMENIPMYLKAKHNPHTNLQIHPLLKDIVKDTHGILIYQEQILQAVKQIANFSLSKADHLRKAIGKKNQAELLALKQDFIEGAMNNKLSQNEALELFETIEKFANYGFNKSHAVAYAMISYQMAYLKANYPHGFYKALLNSVIHSESKTIEYLMSLRKKQLKLGSLSISQSSDQYQLMDQTIILPLTIIKGIGSNLVKNIVLERQRGGQFVDFFDFIARMSLYKMTNKQAEALIYAGALDEFKIRRLDLIASLDDASNYANLVKIEGQDHVQIDLDLVSKPLIVHVKHQPHLVLDKEKEVLGFYLSEHPIKQIKANLKVEVSDIALIKSQQTTQICVMLDQVRAIKTKKNEAMAFVKLSDDTGDCDGILWPNLYNKVKDDLKKGHFYLVRGHFDQRQSFIIQSLEAIHY